MTFGELFPILSSWWWLSSPTEHHKTPDQKKPNDSRQISGTPESYQYQKDDRKPTPCKERVNYGYFRTCPPSGLKPPAFYQTAFIIPPLKSNVLIGNVPGVANTAHGIHRTSLVMRKSVVGRKESHPYLRMEDESKPSGLEPSGSTVLFDSLIDYSSILLNQMVKHLQNKSPNNVSTTQDGYLKTNAEPTNGTALENLHKPDGIMTIPVQPEEQNRLVKILFESGLISKEEFMDDYSKLRKDLPTGRKLTDKIHEAQPIHPSGNSTPTPVTNELKNHYSEYQTPPPPMVSARQGPVMNHQSGYKVPNQRMAESNIWIGEDPARYSSTPPTSSANGCRKAPLVYDPYLEKMQPKIKPKITKPNGSPKPATKPPVLKPKPVPKGEEGGSWFSWRRWFKQSRVYPMCLPDDTNPTIVWDTKNGCWVDKEKV